MTRAGTVLLIDADAEARARAAGAFERAGSGVVTASARDALRALFRHRPDLVLLAIDGPDGWEQLARIRDTTDVPVLVVSHAQGELEKVRALRAGADDYLTKPFGTQELVARAEAVLRRIREPRPLPPVHDDGVLSVDFEQRRVTVDGEEVPLTPQEYRLLATFVQHPNQVLSWAQLVDAAWRNGVGSRPQVKVYIGYLRRKLRAAAPLIQTVRGFGYRYEPADRRANRLDRASWGGPLDRPAGRAMAQVGRMGP